jgi:hypothetical protein
MCECMCVRACLRVRACVSNCVLRTEAHDTRHFAEDVPPAHEMPQTHKTATQGKNVASEDGLLQ